MGKWEMPTVSYRLLAAKKRVYGRSRRRRCLVVARRSPRPLCEPSTGGPGPGFAGESWLAWWEAAERAVPGCVEEELRGYLECGLLCLGFGRALCSGCNAGFVVAFSCKGRGVCPSRDHGLGCHRCCRHAECRLLVARLPTGANSCSSMTTATSFRRRMPNFP